MSKARSAQFRGLQPCSRRARLQFAMLAAGILAVMAPLALMSGSAAAATTHPFDLEFSTGAGCSPIIDVAEVESSSTLYVLCGPYHEQEIKKFDLNGNPVDFTGSASYISGNTITGDPNSPDGAFSTVTFGGSEIGSRMAVDNSNTANNGHIYVSNKFGSKAVDIFDSHTGKWVGSIDRSASGNWPCQAGVGVDLQGNVYVSYKECSDSPGDRAHISKYNPALHEIGRLFRDFNPDLVRPDSTGAVWVGEPHGGTLMKFEADQFDNPFNLTLAEGGAPLSIKAERSPYAGLLNYGPFAVDPVNDDLYLDSFGQITPYSKGVAGDPSHQDGPTFGAGVLSHSSAVYVSSSGQVFASKALTNDGDIVNGDRIVRFAAGDIVPNITTNPPALPDIGHTGATVTGRIDPAGGAAVTNCQLQYGTNEFYSGPGSGTASCSPDPTAAPPGSNFTGPTDVSANLSGLTTGQTYHYRFTASNIHGENIGGDRTVTPAAVLQLVTAPASNITETGVDLNGAFDPDGRDTTYHFEYGTDTSYGASTTNAVVLGSVSGVTPVDSPITGLQRGKTYHYRLVATNNLGTTIGPDETFRTASSPSLSGVHATNVSENAADLNARIDSFGFDTHYHFEYGVTQDYGQSVPVSDTDIGSGNAPQSVVEHISNLQSGVTYHFRIVATNQWGTSASEDATFSFHPPQCPNSHIRQETGSEYLPDCRAYELVSPSNAGGVVLYPSEEVAPGSAWNTEENGFYQAQNLGLAERPARFRFLGGLGSVAGLDAPNAGLDTYMATRTSTGWVTTLPGFKGDEVPSGVWPRCSLTLDICMARRDETNTKGSGYQPSIDHLFDVNGKPLGTLPPNAGVIPNGEFYVGDAAPSGDFTHYAFTSRNIAFTPGGLTTLPGSAYDTNVAAKTVTLISKQANGDDISTNIDPPRENLHIPAISRDGSHILMETQMKEGTSSVSYGHALYMRVNDAVSYDVTRGAVAEFVGMTSNGSTVYFTTPAQLSPEDTDTSWDLYMWSEAGDTVTLVSKGAHGEGNSDGCNRVPTFNDSNVGLGNAAKCDVTPVRTLEGGLPFPTKEYGLTFPSIPGLDNSMADTNGAVYFYSPEILDTTNPGVANHRNLYLYRNGHLQFVTTFDSGTEIDRMNVSPDGRHMALLTASNLTAYDSNGLREMYTYNADTGVIQCASCHPDGTPPATDVLGSQSGPFMANDGRTFFATADSLTSQDTNGLIDVYEFAGGRPQLISAGTGSRDYTGGSGLSTYTFTAVHTGLEAVSADGTDVYFSTFDRLVPQDQNGESSPKFYDARTGGGFEVPPNLAPCQAADECHGAGSSAPPAPGIATGGSLGDSGNAQTPPRGRHKQHKKRHHRRHARRHHG